jgi:predicted amidohydrolase
VQGCRARSLTVAAVQPRCVAYDVAHNATAHAELVRAADARVVVFPELSLTGYELDAPGVRIDDRRLAPIVDACASTGALALVGAPIADRGEHIAMLAVDGRGAEVAYRKMWLSDAEARRFTPGVAPAVVTVDGWRLGLAICKDTGVAAHAAATAALGIDAYVAGVLDSADEAAIQEQRARRITGAHHVWMVVSSFAGSTGGGYESTSARSRVWSPTGEVVAEAGIETGGIARALLTSVSGPPS